MQVQPTTTITLDDQTLEVSKLSTEIQQMVSYLDLWRQKEVDVSADLLMVRGALRDLQNALSTTIQEEVKKTRESAEALGIITPAANDTPGADTVDGVTRVVE
jgi:hypothetical protein